MQTQHIWLLFEFAFGGDFESLFTFLDKHKAVECGETLAYLTFQYNNNLIDELKQEINKYVTLKKQDRMYLIFKENGKLKGKWLFGGRKKAPWAGYAFEDTEAVDDEA